MRRESKPKGAFVGVKNVNPYVIEEFVNQRYYELTRGYRFTASLGDNDKITINCYIAPPSAAETKAQSNKERAKALIASAIADKKKERQ
jgi:hypothetical protein